MWNFTAACILCYHKPNLKHFCPSVNSVRKLAAAATALEQVDLLFNPWLELRGLRAVEISVDLFPYDCWILVSLK